MFRRFPATGAGNVIPTAAGTPTCHCQFCRPTRQSSVIMRTAGSLTGACHRLRQLPSPGWSRQYSIFTPISSWDDSQYDGSTRSLVDEVRHAPQPLPPTPHPDDARLSLIVLPLGGPFKLEHRQTRARQRSPPT